MKIIKSPKESGLLIKDQKTEIEKKNYQDHSNKYITTPEFNNLTAKILEARSKQAKLKLLIS